MEETISKDGSSFFVTANAYPAQTGIFLHCIFARLTINA